MRRVGAAAVAVALVLAACAGGGPDAEENPKDALISAFENLTDRDGHEMVFSLDATVESLQALGSGHPSGTRMKDEELAKVLNSSIRMVTKGKGTDAQAEYVITLDGDDAITMKVVDQVVYFQADARGMVETFGGDPAELEAAATDAEAQGLDFVRPALEGKWIALTGFQELQQQMGGSSAEEMAEEQERFMRDMTEALRETADVEHGGREDAGDHLKVTLPIRDLYTRMMQALQSSLGPAGGFSPLPRSGEVPDESVVLDVWVDDDVVTQVAFDLTQIGRLDGAGENTEGRAVLLIELDEFDDDVQPPDDAVEVEAERLMQVLGGLMMGGAGSGGSTGEFDCSQLEGAPPSVLKQFEAECPQLQPQ